MPAYFDCGFSVREPSWHGMETLLDAYPSDWDEARKLAGLDWEPRSEPAYGVRTLTGAQITQLTADGASVEVLDQGQRPDDRYRCLVAEAGHQRIVRDDTGETLAIPTDSYSLINHSDMGELIEAFLGVDGNLRFETAGSVKGGRQVWALVRLDEPYEVPGDASPTFPFLAMLNAHDGSAACSLTMTDVRVVCWNTWSAADRQGEANGTRHVIRHTGDTAQRVQDAKEAVRRMRDEAHANRELFAQLAATPLLDEQVLSFVERILPSPRDTGVMCSDRVHANVMECRRRWTEVYERSATTEGIRGSAFGALMTTTEYLDHLRDFRSRDSYVGRTILRPERAKAAALDILADITAN